MPRIPRMVRTDPGQKTVYGNNNRVTGDRCFMLNSN